MKRPNRNAIKHHFRKWYHDHIRCSKRHEELIVPDEQRIANNSQTYVVDGNHFSYETLEQSNGHATVICFPMEDPRFHAGDVVVVLSAGEIHFHGMIGRLADGWATAADRRGSLLPASFNNNPDPTVAYSLRDN
jgi:hypothetical protein